MTLRHRLAAGEPLLGTWVHGRDPALVETLGAVGFDLVVVDLEHGEVGLHQLSDLLRGRRHEVLVVLQVEGPEGMAEIEAIFGVPGLDVRFIGPFDLSQHLGVPGETDHPEVVVAMRRIAAAAARRGVVTGTWAATAEATRRWSEAGVGLVTVSNATAIFTEAAGTLLAAACGFDRG
jgi:2-keto-3-deoxy-L-rhamnonate aldolase RhmA